MKRFSAQDFQRIPVIGLRLENLGSTPTLTASDAGYAYWDTALGYPRVWTGSAWINLNNGPAAGSVTSAMIADGTVVDADISASAAISQSKLNLAIADANVASNAAINASKIDATSLATTVKAYTLNSFAVPTGAVAMNGQAITGLANPVNPQDAATKSYVDASAAGFNVQSSVRVATTAPITLSGTQTVDGVALAAGDRVLVKNGSTANPGTSSIDNGIYVVATGAWARAADQSTSSGSTGLQAGDFVFVEQGAASAASAWVVTTQGVITIGTTQVTWAQVGSAGSYTGTTNQITISSNQIGIAPTYAGQTSISTVGTIGVGTWQGTAVGVAYGGTGATTAAGARANLGAAGKFVATGNPASTTWTITHNLGTQDVVCQFFDATSRQQVDIDWVQTDANTITVTFAVAPGANTIRAVVIG